VAGDYNLWFLQGRDEVTCALEAHKLARIAEERHWGRLTERLLVSTVASYVVSLNASAPLAAIRSAPQITCPPVLVAPLSAVRMRESARNGATTSEANLTIFK
jgi:hypothetical protein